MEDWATVAIILGTCLITNLLTWFLTKRQLAHSDKRFEREVDVKREVDEHNRRWEVRREPLIKLREEIACVGEKFQGLINFATQFIEGFSVKSDKIIEGHDAGVYESLRRALKEWEEYYYSGMFGQALHMQSEFSLKKEALEIFIDYGLMYVSLMPFLKYERARDEQADEKIREAVEVVVKNNARISEVQSKINELLEQL